VTSFVSDLTWPMRVIHMRSKVVSQRRRLKHSETSRVMSLDDIDQGPGPNGLATDGFVKFYNTV
jgi:hypothetical protein